MQLQLITLKIQFLFAGILFLLMLPFSCFSQSGPGGVGNSSSNKLWLKADALSSFNDGDPIESWLDISGNNNNATQTSESCKPLYKINILNNNPSLRFDGSNDFMTVASTTWGTNFSIFTVVVPRAALDAHNRILETSYSAHFYLGSGSGEATDCFKFIVNNGSANGAKTGTLTNGNPDIISAVYNGSSNIYENESSPGTYANTTPASSTYLLSIAKYVSGASNYFNGDIAEIIIYNTSVNSSQRIILNNYLSAKYNITLSANDKYSHDATHPHELAGIGSESDGSNTSATSSGILNISGASSLDAGDYLLFGHDKGAIDSWTLTESYNGTDKRISREWKVSKTNDPGTVTITLDISTLPYNASHDYFLLVDADGDFSGGATSYTLTETGNNTFASTGITLSDGDYITFATTQCSTNPGTIAAADTLIYSGESLNLSVSGYTTGASLQWQQSSGGVYSDISGETGTNYTTGALTSGSTYCFRVKATYNGCSVYTNYISPSFKSCLTCADIGGTGDLNTTCTLNANYTIANDKYIYGTGNFILATGRTLTCAQGNRFFIDIGGDVDIQGTGSITGNVTIKCTNLTVSGTINADGKGYAKDSGAGKGGTTASSSQGAGGGGHGGKGGYGQLYTTSSGEAYGSITEPITFGSGGGSQTYSGADGEGGSGGGTIKCFVANTITLNGTLSANGVAGENGGAMVRAAGGGAGGSIWLQAATISGTGSITSNGGAGGAASYDGGGGAGGRIALYYTSNSLSGTISAYGGAGSSSTSETGGAGIIYLKPSSDNGEIIIDNNNNANTLIAKSPIDISTSVTLKNITAGKKGIAEFFGTSQNMSIASNLTNKNNGKILFRNNVGSFTCNSISATDSICFYNTGNVTLNCGNLSASGYIKFYGSVFDINSTGNITFNSGLVFTANGYDRKLDISATDITLNSGAEINLTGNGFGPGEGTKPGVAANSSTHGSGGGGNGGTGGYGGNDGTRFAAGGMSYGTLGDSIIHPFTCGSGGGNNNSNAVKGGSGGGAVKIIASGTCQIDGTIEANGTNGTYSGTYVAGGGAGGSVYINAPTISGSGSISAIGGATNNGDGRQRAGSGGGGKIALIYNTKTFNGTISYYAGGKSPNTANNDLWEIYNAGAAGTLFCKKGSYNGNLYVNNNNNNHISMSNASENYMIGDNITYLDLSASNAFDTIFILNEANLRFKSSTQNTSVGVIKNYNNGKIHFETDVTTFSADNIISEDSVYIHNTGTTTLNIGELTISNDFKFFGSKLKLNATGDITLNSGGKIFASGNERTLETSSTNFTINSGAEITLTGNGYASATGPGAGTSDPTGTCYGAGGASYGGAGGYGNGTEVCPGNEPGTTYGSQETPSGYGSGGGSFTGAKALWEGGSGGGAVKIVSSNTLTVNGTISSNGTNGMNGATNRGPGGGAGGSIWVQAQTLNGNGTISANGGNGGKDAGTNYRGGGGGGGRVSICGVTTDNFYNSGSGTGTVTVTGGVGNYNPPPSGTGANGTIYAQSSGNACVNILPVTLISFDAKCNGQNIILKWVTSSEINNYYFTIEKSADAFNWITLTTIPGAGNSNSDLEYSWTDYSVSNIIHYYRLKQTDYNGAFEYFDPIPVFCSGNSIDVIEILPNPTKGKIEISIYSSEETSADIAMVDNIGRNIFSYNTQILKNINQIKIDISHLASAVYYLRVKTGSGLLSNCKKVILEKD